MSQQGWTTDENGASHWGGGVDTLFINSDRQQLLWLDRPVSLPVDAIVRLPRETDQRLGTYMVTRVQFDAIYGGGSPTLMIYVREIAEPDWNALDA